MSIPIIGKVVESVVKGIDNRNARKHERNIADLENAAQRAEWAAQAAKAAAEQKKVDSAADVSWATEAWKQSGWKDELNSIALWVFFFAGAIPVLQPFVAQAVLIMQGWPLWLQTVFVAHSLASIGIRLNAASKLKLS